MPKFSKRACSICGTIFQPRSEIHEYCSGSCRTEGHRKRHAIEEPAFLSNAKKSIDTPLKVVENISSEFSNKPLSTTDTILDFTDIGVTEYIANPAYIKSVKAYQACLENTVMLEKKRETLKSEINKLNGGSSKAKGMVLGGLATAGLGFVTIYFKAKNTNPLWYLLIIPAAIVGAIAGGALTVASYFGSDKAQKLAQANEKEKELLQLDQEILNSKTKEKDIKIERDAVQKQIARYEKISPEVIYDEFEDLSKQKAISLESLKSKKFNTWKFSDKWKDLIGTPEANFCMMVYGKPGQGKSYFTLELSEYLASNFGTVLFNSSEEGSSLSLQNKIVDFNMENIFLGSADHINSLQLLLTQSPYKFVVIDSVNHMNITPEDLRKLRGLHPTKAFICILQSTKGGDFKGSNEYEHDADISIKIDNRKPECMKTRYK
jgi:hypothetical protein